MASKIKSHTFYAAIVPYKAGANEEEFNELSVMSGYDDVHKYFYVSLHAGWGTGWGGHGCIFLGEDSPLTAPRYVKVKDSPKNSQKTINEMGAALELAKDAIAWLFNKRDWQRLYPAVRNIALYGYTEQFKQQMEKLMQPAPAEAKTEVAEPLKTWNDLKKKNPDAVLLFRSGDFYECYQEDAEEVARICGITLCKSKGLGDTEFYRMAGFPYHALDIYLPKLVRAGKRAAVLDAITNNYNKNQEDNMRLNLNANKSESQNVAMQPQVNNPAAPAIEDAEAVEIEEVEVAEVTDIVPPAPTKKPEPAETKTEGSTPAVTVPLSDHGTMVIAGMPQRDKNGKFLKKGATKAESVADQTTPTPIPEQSSPTRSLSTQEGKPAAAFSPGVGGARGGLSNGTYSVVLMNAKDGGEWPKLYGFKTEKDAEKMVGKMAKSIRNSWDYGENKQKRYYIKAGKKYCEVFQQLADALNKGDQAAVANACKASVAIYEGAVASGKAEREAKRAEREPAEPAPKCYTNEDVAAMLRKVMAGGDVPEDIKKLLKAA